MKKHILVVTLIAGASLVVASAQTPSPTPSVVPTNCPQSSASVEVHSFYGAKETVKNKVSNLPVNLYERRVFLQITQSGRTTDAMTDVKLFEQQKGGGFAITEWKKTKSPGLFDELDDTIIQNKGKHCVGEAIKDVLTKKLGPGKTGEPLTAPVLPKDAFGPSVQDASGDFIKSVIIFGC